MARDFLLRFFGMLILAASCLFLGWQVKAVWAQISLSTVPATLMETTALVAMAYPGLLFLLALAWWRLLQTVGLKRAPTLRACWRIFLRMQAAKYLPGNVFQYLGRVEMLGRRGVSRRAVAVSLVHESVLLAAVALLLGAGGLSQAVMTLGELKGRFMAVAAACLVGLPMLWMLHRYLAGAKGGRVALGASWLTAGVLYALFFLGMAGALWLLAQRMGHALPVGMCLAAATVPWLLGFITPGAPGGLGVREAVMLALLKPVLPAVDALVLVLAMRLVTLFGDLFALPWSYLPLRDEGGVWP